MFFCPVDKWFDSGPDADPGKPSWTVDCHKSGIKVIYYKASKQAKIKGNQSFITDESLKECSNKETSVTPTANPSSSSGAYTGEIYHQNL